MRHAFQLPAKVHDNVRKLKPTHGGRLHRIIASLRAISKPHPYMPKKLKHRQKHTHATLVASKQHAKTGGYVAKTGGGVTVSMTSSSIVTRAVRCVIIILLLACIASMPSSTAARGQVITRTSLHVIMLIMARI